jgi:hypothetical protein
MPNGIFPRRLRLLGEIVADPSLEVIWNGDLGLISMRGSCLVNNLLDVSVNRR